MKEIKSFTLSSDVVASLEQIPRLERSRTVNAILQRFLPGWLEGKPSQPSVNVEQVRSIVLQVLADHQSVVPNANTNETEKARAIDALAAILGMREGLES